MAQAEVQYDIFISFDAGVATAFDNRTLDMVMEESISSIERQMSKFDVLMLSVSYGADSSTMTALTIEAARRFKAKHGYAPKIHILTGLTGVDNPLIPAVIEKTSNEVIALGEELGIDIHQHFARPHMLSRYFVSILGGQTVVSDASKMQKCSINLKIDPINRVRNQILRQYRGNGSSASAQRVLQLTGTIYSESNKRSGKMHERGERWDSVWEGKKKGEVFLSPLAHWDKQRHVMSFLDRAAAGALPFKTPSFLSVIALYELTGADICPASIGGGQDSSSCSGARTGCWTCQATEDKSLKQIVRTHPKYKALVNFNRYLKAGVFVPYCRNWLGRTIDEDCTVEIAPNSYSYYWVRDLLIALGNVQRISDLEVISFEEVLAIGWQWQKYYDVSWTEAVNAFQGGLNAVDSDSRYHMPMDDDLYVGRLISKLESDSRPSSFFRPSGSRLQLDPILKGLGNWVDYNATPSVDGDFFDTHMLDEGGLPTAKIDHSPAFDVDLGDGTRRIENIASIIDHCGSYYEDECYLSRNGYVKVNAAYNRNMTERMQYRGLVSQDWILENHCDLDFLLRHERVIRKEMQMSLIAVA